MSLQYYYTGSMESAYLPCYDGWITSMRGLKMVRRKRDKYITSMLECWKHDSRRMPRRTWQECVLWLNIPVSHPAMRGVLATQGDKLNIAHLTRRMCLFENGIPLWVLFMGEVLHTHAYRPEPCMSVPLGFTRLRNTTAFFTPYSHLCYSRMLTGHSLSVTE